MPHSTTALETLVRRLVDQADLHLGEIWNASDTPAAVAPILRTGGPSDERGYVLFDEIEDVDIQDTGDINRLRLAFASEDPVLIRSGTVLEGKGTQNRVVCVSKLVTDGASGDPDPLRTVEIPVRCVHASHGIRRGASFERASADAPAEVRREAVSGDQGRVWSSIEAFADKVRDSVRETSDEPRVQASRDDLVGQGQDPAVGETMNEYIREIPVFEDQVGVAVFDEEGVVGVELFDHPASWQVVAERVLRAYGGTFLEPRDEETQALDLNAQMALEALTGFVETIGGAKTKEVDGSTWRLVDPVVGEYTVREEHVIHLNALRDDDRDGRRRGRDLLDVFRSRRDIIVD